MTAMATVCPSPTAAADRGHSLTTGDQSIKIGELIRVGVDPALSRQDAVRPDHRDQRQGDVRGGRSSPESRRVPRPRPEYDDEGMFDCASPGRVHYASRDGQLRVAVESLGEDQFAVKMFNDETGPRFMETYGAAEAERLAGDLAGF